MANEPSPFRSKLSAVEPLPTLLRSEDQPIVQSIRSPTLRPTILFDSHAFFRVWLCRDKRSRQSCIATDERLCFRRTASDFCRLEERLPAPHLPRLPDSQAIGTQLKPPFAASQSSIFRTRRCRRLLTVVLARDRPRHAPARNQLAETSDPSK